MEEEQNNKKMPHFITKNEDGTFTVTSKNKEYVLKELKGYQVRNAFRLAESMNKSHPSVLAMKSLISPEMSESDFFNIKGGAYNKLGGAVQYVYALDEIENNDFIVENEDETYTINANGVDYTLEEISGEELEKCYKEADKDKKPKEVIVALKSLVSPKLTEEELDNLPGSTYFKITGSVQYIYELTDFLE